MTRAEILAKVRRTRAGMPHLHPDYDVDVHLSPIASMVPSMRHRPVSMSARAQTIARRKA